jgi:hypothetical protein
MYIIFWLENMKSKAPWKTNANERSIPKDISNKLGTWIVSKINLTYFPNLFVLFPDWATFSLFKIGTRGGFLWKLYGTLPVPILNRLNCPLEQLPAIQYGFCSVE